MLELYHHGTSACAAKVRLALAEKELDWHGHYVDLLLGEQFRPEFLAINPKAVVPVLVHDDVVIPESTVICEYLEDAFPAAAALFPRAAVQRARVRLWTKAVDEELHPACSALTYVVSHRHAILRQGVGSFEAFLANGAREGREARLRKWQWIQQGLAAPGVADQVRLYGAYLGKMERALADSEWLVGEAFSMADVALAPYVNRLDALALSGLWENGRLPGVARWFARMRERRAFTAAILDWIPAALRDEMRANGERSRRDIEQLLR